MLTALLKPASGSGEMEITGNKVLAVIANARPAHIDLIKDKIFRASRRASCVADAEAAATIENPHAMAPSQLSAQKNDGRCRNNNALARRQLAAV
ncbi:MAG TPA: hypothetical protein VFX37_09170 [Pseudolabrys sp.]|nr:hypothetical protein [Pseudolabrys sp.]